MTKAAFLVDLEENGYTVVRNVIPPETCEKFQAAALQWIEDFKYGFKRDDKSTWTEEQLPYSSKGGLYNRYAVNHESFVWDIRLEPGVRKVFEEVWGTEDLIVSFDGMNVSQPINAQYGRTDLKPTTPWPHLDQNPRRIHLFELYQGIANLAPNGPDDGGLVVLKGSHKLNEEYLKACGGWRPEQDAGEDQNGYRMTQADTDWYRARGCEEVKVCAGPGDFILWDSRTIHWNASPVGTQTRFATYICMCPRNLASKEDLAKKLEVFRNRRGTTHFPMNVIPEDNMKHPNRLPTRPDGTVDPANRSSPISHPLETPGVLRLVGVSA